MEKVSVTKTTVTSSKQHLRKEECLIFVSFVLDTKKLQEEKREEEVRKEKEIINNLRNFERVTMQQ